MPPESSPFYVFQHFTTHSGPWELFVPSGSTGFADSNNFLLISHLYGIQRSSSTPSRVILMPNKYKEYLHLTQAAKSASISFIVQTDNASACL